MTEIIPLRIGQDVPNFTLETYEPAQKDFGTFALEVAKATGKWTLLFFYPADFTFAGPTELADLAEKHDQLAALGGHVVGVSTDSKYAHLAWRNSEKLLAQVNYALAADPTGAVSRLFGVYDESAGHALRGTFIINPQGKLVASEISLYNVGRDADQLVRKLEANAYLVNHPEQACPAKWQPGSKTLAPNQ